MACHEIEISRGGDHLMLRREFSQGEVIYVGYLNGVEEVMAPTKADAFRRLLRVAERPSSKEP